MDTDASADCIMPRPSPAACSRRSSCTSCSPCSASGSTVLRAAGNTQQFISALAWWAIGGAGFVGGWGTGGYLIAAAREREFVYRLAQRFLIAVVFAVATAGGIMSKSGNLGGTVDVIAGLTALGLGLICAFCGARLAYLNAEQV